MTEPATTADVSISMSIHVGDWLRETSHLSPAELGTHMRLVTAAWSRGGYLPVERERLARIVGARTDADLAALDYVVLELWREVAEGIHHPRTLAEIGRARAAKASLSARGRAGRAAQLSARADAGPTPATARADAGQPPPPPPPTPDPPPQPPPTPGDPGVGAEAPADGRSPPAAAEPALVEFLARGPVKTWSLTQSIVDELRDAYPDLDIIAQAKKAKAWIAANPTRTPTARGARAFLTRWLSRVQDSPRGRQATPGRDVRVGSVRAEDCHHDGRVGEIPL